MKIPPAIKDLAIAQNIGKGTLLRAQDYKLQGYRTAQSVRLKCPADCQKLIGTIQTCFVLNIYLLEIKMNFSEALDLIKQGKKLQRAGWNGKDMFLYYVPGSEFVVNRAPLLGIYPEGTTIQYHAHIDMKTAQGYCVPWLASQADLLADDWQEVV